MAQKSALIVDDSRTARQVLARVLEQHDVRVEMAESAEDALELLSHERPDVIFMDHMMPGMDGFQAVKVIKSNPATATIPIMMYTSQEGELYVGQARALGAVGVLPKQIKPVEVSQLLESLHVVPPRGEPRSAGRLDASANDAVAPDSADALPGDWPEMHRWLEGLLDQHGQELRADIEKTMQRLLDEQALELKAAPPQRRRTDRMAWWEFRKNWVIAGLAAIAIALLWRQLDTGNALVATSEENASLRGALDAQRAVARNNEDLRQRLAEERAGQDSQYVSFLAALEWTANQSAPYTPGGVPLGEDRLQMLDGLIQRLLAVGFTGRVEVASHVGDFCLVTGRGGGLEPAPDDLAMADCAQVGWAPEEALQMSGRQSVAFANYVAALEGQALSPISVSVASYGNSRPRYPYPSVTQGTTAGEWNEVARRNNRVEFRLLPE